MRDFESGLKEMYGINWARIHYKIFRHKKTNVYALLYWDDLVSHAAENSIMKHLEEENISNLKVFDEPHGQILTIITGVKPNGTPVRCVFVDANRADDYINSLPDSRRSPSETARVRPWGTG